ncbi:hypothetical protein BC828DRAFT_388172 [Blastocladiella britannica]|nr:hypothetical protein BC828DRAFT_388172 [Blastocladiella britannica]
MTTVEREFHIGGLPLGRYLYGPANKVTPSTAREAVMLLGNALSDYVDPRFALEYHHVLFGANPVCLPEDEANQEKVRIGVSFKTDSQLGTVAIVSVRHDVVAGNLAMMGSLDPQHRMYQHDMMFVLPADYVTALPDCTWTLGGLSTRAPPGTTAPPPSRTP